MIIPHLLKNFYVNDSRLQSLYLVGRLKVGVRMLISPHLHRMFGYRFDVVGNDDPPHSTLVQYYPL